MVSSIAKYDVCFFILLKDKIGNLDKHMRIKFLFITLDSFYEFPGILVDVENKEKMRF